MDSCVGIIVLAMLALILVYCLSMRKEGLGGHGGGGHGGGGHGGGGHGHHGHHGGHGHHGHHGGHGHGGYGYGGYGGDYGGYGGYAWPYWWYDPLYYYPGIYLPEGSGPCLGCLDAYKACVDASNGKEETRKACASALEACASGNCPYS